MCNTIDAHVEDLSLQHSNLPLVCVHVEFSVRDRAFYCCVSLELVVLPASCRLIGHQVLAYSISPSMRRLRLNSRSLGLIPCDYCVSWNAKRRAAALVHSHYRRPGL